MQTFEKLQERHNHLKQYKHVVKQTRQFLDKDFTQQGVNLAENFEQNVILEHFDEDYIEAFDFITGVVDIESKLRFKRMIFRGTRGNTLCIFTDVEQPMEDPITGIFHRQSVFLIFFISGTLEMLRQKIQKICDSFGAKTYNIDRYQYKATLQKVRADLSESLKVLRITKE